MRRSNGPGTQTQLIAHVRARGDTQMAASPPRTPKMLKSFTMPVDPTAFAGVPSVTALKPLPAAKVLLAAAMDRRVVCCDLTAEGSTPIRGTHLRWSHDN